MSGPPDFSKIRLDFSEFHPTGDHWPFSRYCRTFSGGGRRHLELAWSYRYLPELRRLTLCRLGVHQPVEGWTREGDDWTPYRACRDCGAL